MTRHDRSETVRILVIQPLFQPGGAEKQIASLATRFLQRGHTITLLTCKMALNEWTDRIRGDGLEILETGSDLQNAPRWISDGYVGKLRTAGILGSFLKKNRALVTSHDIVNLHNWPSYIAARAAGLYESSAPPLVWTCNEPTDFWYSKNPLLRYLLHPLEKTAIRALPFIVVLSTYMRDLMRRRYAVDSTIIPPGVDVPIVPPEPFQERRGEQRRLDVLCYTRMSRFPIDVLARIRRQIPNVMLHLFGDRATLAYRYASRRGLQASVVVHGWQPESMMSSFMASMDVMIFPHVAPFGLTALEALAVGVPVISVEAGGQLDIIRNGFNGYTVPSSSPENFAKALLAHLSTITSPEMRLRCAQDAVQRFSWDTAASHYLKLFEEAIRRNLDSIC